MPGLLHLVIASLRAEAEPDALARATDLARSLSAAAGVGTVAVGRSDDRLVVATWLTDRLALEPFAASAPHMEFVMRGVAPVTARMSSAAVEIDTPSDPSIADARMLWAFALRAQDDVYEWQIRRLLADIETLPGETAAGPTVEDRERSRAAGVVCLAAGQLPAFERALAEARTRWEGLAGGLEEALVPILR